MRISDWSSDVCSSDLVALEPGKVIIRRKEDIEFVGGAPRRAVRDGNDRRRVDRSMLITDTRDQMRRVAKQVEFVRHLKIGRERLFIAAAIDRIVGQAAIRRTRAVTSAVEPRSAEPTSELQSLMRLSYAVFYWKKKN